MSKTHLYSLLFSKADLRMAFSGFTGGFLAQSSTAKLHRFTLTCFFSPYFSPLLDFCCLYFWFYFLSLLASPSLLRRQTWAPLRSVERALGSINRITGVARAGVYGVCLHRPGPGEGWLTVHWDFLLCSPLLPFPSSSPHPASCLFRQAIVTSQLPPAMSCRSISRFSLCV